MGRSPRLLPKAYRERLVGSVEPRLSGPTVAITSSWTLDGIPGHRRSAPARSESGWVTHRPGLPVPCHKSWCLWVGVGVGKLEYRGHLVVLGKVHLIDPISWHALQVAVIWFWHLNWAWTTIKMKNAKKLPSWAGFFLLPWLKQHLLIYKRQWSCEKGKDLVGRRVWKARVWEYIGWWAVTLCFLGILASGH